MYIVYYIVYIYTHIHIYIYIYACVYIYIYIYMYLYDICMSGIQWDSMGFIIVYNGIYR